MKILVNKHNYVFNEEEAIEVELRFLSKIKKLPIAIGYNERQKKTQFEIYQNLDCRKLNEEQAVNQLKILMEEYYGMKV